MYIELTKGHQHSAVVWRETYQHYCSSAKIVSLLEAIWLTSTQVRQIVQPNSLDYSYPRGHCIKSQLRSPGRGHAYTLLYDVRGQKVLACSITGVNKVALPCIHRL